MKFAARRYFVENGSPLQTSTLQSKLDRYLPKTALSGGRPRDGWIQVTMLYFIVLHTDITLHAVPSACLLLNFIFRHMCR